MLRWPARSPARSRSEMRELDGDGDGDGFLVDYGYAGPPSPSSAYPLASLLTPNEPRTNSPALGAQQPHWPYQQQGLPAHTLRQYYQDTRNVPREQQIRARRRHQRSPAPQPQPPGSLPPWLMSSYRSASLTHHKPLTAAWAQHELDLLERTPRSAISQAFRDQVNAPRPSPSFLCVF